MSGDRGAEAVVRAAKLSLDLHPNLRLILVGDSDELESLVATHVGSNDRLTIRHASEVVEMSEAPADALRRKKDSSMRVAINLVKEGEAQACVSSGNTGALMATAKFVLKMLPGIDRPAIITELPAKGGTLHMLDLGANTLCTADHLFQFAVMGSVVASQVGENPTPRVALLNIGSEDIKGNAVVREAAGLIGGSSLNYVGFIEANEIFSNRADVIVCDGFTGNVALKAIEGTSVFVREMLREAFGASLYSRLAAAVCAPVFRALGSRLDHRRYNGASLVGLDGIVIKSHGGTDAFGFASAVDLGIDMVRSGMISRIARDIERAHLEQEQPEVPLAAASNG